MNEAEWIAKLKSLGYEETDTPCPECGTPLIERAVNIWLEGNEQIEYQIQCPHCIYQTVEYDG